MLHRSLILGTSVLALAACGPEEIASPGQGGDIIVNNPAPTPAPTTGTPTPTGTFTAAASCPTINASGGLSDGGVLTVPGGTVRVCALPQVIDASSTLERTPDSARVVYEIPGRVDVGTDGGPTSDDSDGASDSDITLSIAPGAVLFGGTGNSYLLVNRGNQINAVGTSSDPIIFTSEQNVLGNTTDDSEQQWGGIILLGRAPISDCLDAGATGGTTACENEIEGASPAALFGGDTLGDDSGNIEYAQIRFSGFVIGADNELQSLTTGGTGHGTTLNNIQSVNSSDDGVEFFGGAVDMKNLVVLGASDDTIDTDFGVQANLQWLIGVQRTSTGNGMIEGDSGGDGDSLPRQDLRISNATFVAQSTASDAAAFRFRGGMDVALANVVLDATAYNQACLDVDDDETLQTSGSDENGVPFFAAVFMDCNGTSYTADGNEGATEAAFDAAANGAFSGGGINKLDDTSGAEYTNTLTMVFVNGATENGFATYDPSAFDRSSFSFDSPGFVGAADGTTTWYQGWTCNTGYANMSGSSNCAASPVA